MRWLNVLILLGFGFSWAAVPTEPKSDVNAKPKTDIKWPEECKLGPTYWCQNIRAATDCGAVKHCNQTVWIPGTGIVTVEKDSSSCKKCVEYVEEIKNATSNNMTLKQMEIVLETACELIPTTLIAKECQLAVKMGVPEIGPTVRKINSHKFCSVLFLCDSMTANKKYFEVKNIKVSDSDHTEVTTSTSVDTPVSKDIDCKGCYFLFTTAQKMFKKSSRDAVLNGLTELCGKMSSFSDACRSYVITYFSEIYEHLHGATVSDVCHLSGTCDALYHFHENTPELDKAVAAAPETANDEVCDFCVAMVKHVKDMVVANTTEEEFQKVLQGICKQTKSFQNECLDLVNQYYSLVYHFLIEELDGQELCKEIKLCVPKTKLDAIAADIPLFPIVPSSVNIDGLLKNETSFELHRVELTHDAPEGLNHLVGANKCTWGPGYWCKNMTTSKECSGSLNHCIKEVWEKMELPVDNGDICNICKDMVKQARDQLNSNETQEELREVFEGSCKLIPVKIARKECIRVVDDFVPELVETLSSQMNPQVVCATVGLCNSAKMDLLLQQEKVAASAGSDDLMNPLPIDRLMPSFLQDVEQKDEVVKRGKEACEMCEVFLHYVQQEITLPKSESQIKNVVNSVCIKLPKSVSTQCSSFIDIYGDDFISILAQEIDPSVVCPNIGACPAYLGFIDKVKPTCPLCLFAVESVERALENNKTEASVKKSLDDLCRTMPAHLLKDCERFVNKSYSDLVDSILADFSPQETCLFLRLCSPSIKEAEIVPTSSSSVSNEESNEIKSLETDVEGPNKCVLCEFVMSKLDSDLKDKKTAEEIKQTVLDVCNHMPGTVNKQCIKFVKQYADLVIDLLAASLDPREVCSKLHLCNETLSFVTITKGDNTLSVKEPSSLSDTKSEQINTFIVYVSLAATVCVFAIVLTIFKIRKSTLSPPYTQVNN